SKTEDKKEVVKNLEYIVQKEIPPIDPNEKAIAALKDSVDKIKTRSTRNSTPTTYSNPTIKNIQSRFLDSILKSKNALPIRSAKPTVETPSTPTTSNQQINIDDLIAKLSLLEPALQNLGQSVSNSSFTNLQISIEEVEETQEDESDFVTETLAEIHASQGNYAKAKKIYQKLMLKYPEKKAYFEAQIQKLG
ncbi:MAG: hypothetical protein NZ108_02400, partial [Bacteroidia bacterium]|nr:hypothetical protein [Bacteroidia bacterium]